MTVLALLAIWAGLIAFLLLAVNRYRDGLEAAPPQEDVIVAYIGAKRLVRKGRR